MDSPNRCSADHAQRPQRSTRIMPTEVINARTLGSPGASTSAQASTSAAALSGSDFPSLALAKFKGFFAVFTDAEILAVILMAREVSRTAGEVKVANQNQMFI